MTSRTEAIRGNIYIQASEEGYTVWDRGVATTYKDPHEASEADIHFRYAYKCLLAGISRLNQGKLHPTEAHQLRPDCWALSSRFLFQGSEAQLEIFTRPGKGNQEETLAVQVTLHISGRYVDLYSNHPRQCHHFDRFLSDRFLASAQTYLA